MKNKERLIHTYFAFSSKEKRGMLVLTGILFLLLFVNVYKGLSPVRYEDWQIEHLANLAEPEIKPEKQISYESFNPNTSDSLTLLSGGLSPKQAAALIRYRERGAVFKRKEDLLRLYWMSDELYSKLHIEITTPPITSKENSPKYKPDKPLRERVNLNTADSITLVNLKGIGAYTAFKLIRYRTWLGGFIDTGQIREVKGLREEQIQILLQHHSGELQVLQKISINQVGLKQLQSHPYIRFKAKVLFAYRKQHGPFKALQDLIKTGVFTATELERLQPYIDLSP